MAKLNAAKRKALPASDFAASGRRYPVNDKAHAKAAEARKGQARPPLTTAEKHRVDVKAAKYGVGPLAKKKGR